MSRARPTEAVDWLSTKGWRWSVALVSLGLLLACPVLAAEPDPYLTHSLQWDDDLSSNAGARSLLAFHRLYRIADDRLLRAFDFDRRGSRRVFGVAARVGKTLLLDVPIAQGVTLIQHEVFGHGARARGFGATGIDYHFGGLWPYSDEDWSTDATLPPRAPLHQRIGFVTGGLEATWGLAHEQAFQWLERGEMDHREALLYVFAFHDEADYILRRFEGPNADPRAYLDYVNRYYRLPDLEKSTLRRGVLVNLLDSFTWLAFCNQLRYWATAADRSGYRLLRIGALDLAPGLRLSLSPFGAEYYLQAYGLYRGLPGYAYLRYGEQSGRRFYGLGLELRRLWQRRRISVDVELDLWRQPELGVPARVAGDRSGAQAVVWIRYRFLERFAAAAGLGAKTAGFVPGEPFDSGPIVRLALGVVERFRGGR